MNEDLAQKLEEALKNMLSMLRTNCPQEESLKYSQSVLNLAHAKQLLEGKK